MCDDEVLIYGESVTVGKTCSPVYSFLKNTCYRAVKRVTGTTLVTGESGVLVSLSLPHFVMTMKAGKETGGFLIPSA